MNKTDYVTLEVAKLLKKIGFKLYCRMSYWDDELTVATPGYPLENGETSQENYFDFPRYYAPSIWDLLMWLYDEYNIWVSVETDHVCFNPTITNMEIEKKLVSSLSGKTPYCFTAPHEAYNGAFEYILTNWETYERKSLRNN